MPVCTIYLLSLRCSIPNFCLALSDTPARPLTVARVCRWIVKPTILSKDILLSEAQSWDLLLILPDISQTFPESLRTLVCQKWTIQAGIPSKLLDTYENSNARLLDASITNAPSWSGSSASLKYADSSQHLELTQELNDWIRQAQSPLGAVSMLNLLAFHPGKKEQYMKYGRAFGDAVGSRRGGVAKLVGKIVPKTCSDGCNEWEEVGSYP